MKIKSTHPSQRRVLALIKGLTSEGPDKVNPEKLSLVEVDSIIEYLRFNENATVSDIAVILDTSTSFVYRRLKKITEKARKRLSQEGWDTRRFVLELLRAKSFVQSKALKSGDIALFWKVEMETIDKLEKLGVLPKSDTGIIDVGFSESVKEVPEPKAIGRILRVIQSDDEEES